MWEPALDEYLHTYTYESTLWGDSAFVWHGTASLCWFLSVEFWVIRWPAYIINVWSMRCGDSDSCYKQYLWKQLRHIHTGTMKDWPMLTCIFLSLFPGPVRHMDGHLGMSLFHCCFPSWSTHFTRPHGQSVVAIDGCMWLLPCQGTIFPSQAHLRLGMTYDSMIHRMTPSTASVAAPTDPLTAPSEPPPASTTPAPWGSRGLRRL